MKNKIFLITALLAVLFMFSSCLKDDHDYWQDDVKGKMYATIASPGLQTKSILPVAEDVTFEFLVNIATDKLPSKAITIDLAFDNAAISAYDSTLKAKARETNDTLADGSLNWKDYKPFPSVELLTPNITIAPGTRNFYAKFKISRADTVNLAGFYMTALTITNSTVPIAENMKTVLFAFPIANKYEGDYNSVGFRDHPTAGIQPFDFAKVNLSTIDATTVWKGQVANYAGYGIYITVHEDQPMLNHLGETVYKCTLRMFNSDANGKPALPELTDWAYYTVDEKGNPTNYYNPSSKSFELYYYYNVPAPRKCRESNFRLE